MKGMAYSMEERQDRNSKERDNKGRGITRIITQELQASQKGYLKARKE